VALADLNNYRSPPTWIMIEVAFNVTNSAKSDAAAPTVLRGLAASPSDRPEPANRPYGLRRAALIGCLLVLPDRSGRPLAMPARLAGPFALFAEAQFE